jgi:hypothetical protein
MPIGSIISSNLTPAGPLKRSSDGEIFRAIRNSVDADGRWLTLFSLIVRRAGLGAVCVRKLNRIART